VIERALKASNQVDSGPLPRPRRRRRTRHTARSWSSQATPTETAKAARPTDGDDEQGHEDEHAVACAARSRQPRPDPRARRAREPPQGHQRRAEEISESQPSIPEPRSSRNSWGTSTGALRDGALPERKAVLQAGVASATFALKIRSGEPYTRPTGSGISGAAGTGLAWKSHTMLLCGLHTRTNWRETSCTASPGKLRKTPVVLRTACCRLIPRNDRTGRSVH
jgi:hypothetical protein